MKKYPIYKDSGIEWLGEIPENWVLIRLKFLLSGNLKYGANESGEYENHEHPRYIRITDFDNAGKLRDDTFKSLSPEVAEEYLLQEGDVLFARSGATVGKTFIFKNFNGRACFAGYLIKATPNKNLLLPEFLYQVTLSNHYKNWKNSVFIQATIQNIGADKYQNLLIPTPPLPEQTAVVSFLDHKTQQIDDLIAKKERLIELLKEERTAVINQAVTKGLDPNVPMKDSGIEWLGEIPEHWEVKSLKRICIINPQKSEIDIIKFDYAVFLPMEKVGEDGTYDSSGVYPTKELVNGYTYFCKGDIILAKITPCFENGKGAILNNLPTQIGFGSTEFHVIRPLKNKSEGHYIYFLTYSEIFKSLGEAYMTGAAGQKRVPTSFIENFKFPIPPYDEQKIIAQEISMLNFEIDNTTIYIRRQIELLKEYKTSLINSAVTGKIDVREYYMHYETAGRI